MHHSNDEANHEPKWMVAYNTNTLKKCTGCCCTCTTVNFPLKYEINKEVIPLDIIDNQHFSQQIVKINDEMYKASVISLCYQKWSRCFGIMFIISFIFQILAIMHNLVIVCMTILIICSLSIVLWLWCDGQAHKHAKECYNESIKRLKQFIDALNENPKYKEKNVEFEIVDGDEWTIISSFIRAEFATRKIERKIPNIWVKPLYLD